MTTGQPSKKELEKWHIDALLEMVGQALKWGGPTNVKRADSALGELNRRFKERKKIVNQGARYPVTI